MTISPETNRWCGAQCDAPLRKSFQQLRESGRLGTEVGHELLCLVPLPIRDVARPGRAGSHASRIVWPFKRFARAALGARIEEARIGPSTSWTGGASGKPGLTNRVQLTVWRRSRPDLSDRAVTAADAAVAC